jgi:hypothetical protein
MPTLEAGRTRLAAKALLDEEVEEVPEAVVAVEVDEAEVGLSRHVTRISLIFRTLPRRWPWWSRRNPRWSRWIHWNQRICNSRKRQRRDYGYDH